MSSAAPGFSCTRESHFWSNLRTYLPTDLEVKQSSCVRGLRLSLSTSKVSNSRKNRFIYAWRAPEGVLFCEVHQRFIRNQETNILVSKEEAKPPSVRHVCIDKKACPSRRRSSSSSSSSYAVIVVMSVVLYGWRLRCRHTTVGIFLGAL